VTLVDIHGRPITPDDQGDAAAWPQSNLVDDWHWEPGSGQDDAPTAAERADFESWLASVDDDPFARAEAEDACLDPLFGTPRYQASPTPIELAQLAAHGAI
jgi:hypothetical protein